MSATSTWLHETFQSAALRLAGSFSGWSARGAQVRVAHGREVDLAELERFRYRIYVEEMRKALPQADHAERRLPDRDDESAWHLLARSAQGRLLGCVRLHLWPQMPPHLLEPLGLSHFVEQAGCNFGYVSRLMVAREVRGAGIPIALMRRMVELGHGSPHQGQIAFFHCHPRLVPLYERLGLRRFGRRFVDPHVGTQCPMYIMGGDVAGFQACRSPLAGVARRYRLEERRVAALRGLLPATED